MCCYPRSCRWHYTYNTLYLNTLKFTSIPFTSIPFTSIPFTSNRHVAAGAHHGRAAGRQPLRVECARILIGPTGTGGVKVAASSRNGGKRQRRLTLRLTLRRRTDRQQRPATTTARSTCFCPGCCRMTSTNWSISERTVPLAFGRNRFGEMNGEFARSNRRFAPFYAKEGSSVTTVRPETDALQA